ncbi:MAG: NADH-quinone oxidoreductase subunit C [Planctomycetota bacterium]|nr:NADH-quinone oxidoreductase subunit C [Planctomycetota bacterium]
MSTRIADLLADTTCNISEDCDGTLLIDIPERVAAGTLRTILETLKGPGGFDTCTFVTAVDRLGRAPRFDLIHQLRSVERSERVRVRSYIDADSESAPSIMDLWPGAAYSERECFDMFGIAFEGHENLKRLLMPDDFPHHPLRKDFPHQGIEPDALYRAWEAGRGQDSAEDGR